MAPPAQDRAKLLDDDASSVQMETSLSNEDQLDVEYCNKEVTTTQTGSITWVLLIIVIIFIFPAVIIFIRCGIIPLILDNKDVLTSLMTNSSADFQNPPNPKSSMD